jgi:hypothetical protein
LAAVDQLAPQKLGIQWHVVTSSDPEERLAISSLSFDLATTFAVWEPAQPPLRFHLYMLICDDLPDDPLTVAAIRSARLTLAGLSSTVELRAHAGILFVSGHDTAAYAEIARRLLSNVRYLDMAGRNVQ